MGHRPHGTRAACPTLETRTVSLANLLDRICMRPRVETNPWRIATMPRCIHMRMSSPAALLVLVTLTLLGCEEGKTAAPGKTSTEAGGAGGQSATEARDEFEIEGSWLYLGPWDGPHTLEITSETVEYVDITNEWNSNWTLKEYDNELRRFELVFKSGEGEYAPTGESL